DAVLDIPDSDSADGFAVLDEHFTELGAGTQSGTIVFRADQGGVDLEVTAAKDELFALVDAGFPDEDGVPEHPGATVISPYSEQGEGQIAGQGPLAGEVAYAQVNLAADIDLTESALIGEAIAEHAPAIEGLEVFPGGAALAPYEPPGSELIGLAFAIFVLIVAFGSVLAMGLPVAVALGGVGAGIAATLLLSNVYPIPDFTLSVGVMIGLGVGIDYALFIVTRYREGLHGGMTPEHAVIRAIDTAGRAVLFAGITVIIAVLGLFTVGLDMINGLAVGISLGVLMTMLAALTLLPAVLGFVGRNIDKLGLPHRRKNGASHHTSIWYRWSRLIQRKPWPALVLGAVALLALAAPGASLRLGFGDAGNRPDSDTTRRAYDLLSEGFGPGFNGPLLLVAEAPGGMADMSALQGLSTTLSKTPGVVTATPPIPNEAGDAAILSVFPTTAPQDEDTHALVKTLREDVIPTALEGTTAVVKVGGWTAGGMDFAD
ncbi:MAG: MMPL family transporter, partial [Acidimicrobiales bacterium]